MGTVQFIVSLLPSFGLIFGLVLLITLIVAGVWLPLFKQKITWLEIGFSYYFSVVVFTIWCYFSWYFVPWQTSVMIILLPMGLAAAWGWWRVRQRLDLKLSPLSLGLALLTTGLSLALYKLTYENGLHDEYFHHAVLALFKANGQYPFLNPYQIGDTLNHSYHVGTYFLAITSQWLGGLSIEVALDVAKLLFFVPFPLVLGLSIKKLFSATHWTVILVLVAASLLSGPFFFFQDTFSLWLFKQAELPQIYMPIMYDLAGITWAGLLVSLVIILFSWLWAEKKVLINPTVGIGGVGIGLIGLALINTAFFLTIVAMLVVLLMAFGIQKKLWHKLLRGQWLMGAVLLAAICIAIWISPVGQLLQSYILTAGLLRTTAQWGYAYASNVIEGGIQVDHAYLQLSDHRFWQAFGILPVIALVVIIWRGWQYSQLSTAQRYLWWLLLAAVGLLPLLVAVVADHGLGLALNKLLRPGVLLLPLLFYILPDTGRIRLLRWVWLALVGLSMFSPSYYLFVNNGSGLQQFWKGLTPDDQEAIEFLQKQKVTSLEATSWASTYIFANNVPAQVEVCFPCLSPSQEFTVTDKNLPDENVFVNNPNFELRYTNQSYQIYRKLDI